MNNAVAIRSAIPGRERWQIGPLRSQPSYAVAIERALSRHAPVRYAWANPLTGRLLLQYDPGVQPEEVRDRLYASLDAAPANDDEVTEWRTTWPHGFNRSLEDVAVGQARLRLFMSAGLFTGVLATPLRSGCSWRWRVWTASARTSLPMPAISTRSR